jgi:signal transduction histidine kinase
LASTVATRSGSWLAEACKSILAFRGFVLLLTLVWIPTNDGVPLLIVAMLLAVGATWIPLHFWDAVSPAILRHPAYLALEILLAAAILTLTGPQSPFFLFTLGTAALAGLIYGYPGALVLSALLVVSYLAVFQIRADIDGLPESFDNLVGAPALYPIAALSAAAVRRLFERQLFASAAAGEREREAAGERERARLARDMHDSLAKTVHGIALEAAALHRGIRRNPDAAIGKARTLADDAEEAAREARGLIHGLRRDGVGPLWETVRARAREWEGETGVPVEVEAQELEVSPATAHELLQILVEALRNVERHARATRVRIELRHDDGRVVLSVADDGEGFAGAGTDPVDGLHFGLVGMRERAELLGGELATTSRPDEGTTVTAAIPSRVDRSRAEPAT